MTLTRSIRSIEGGILPMEWQPASPGNCRPSHGFPHATLAASTVPIESKTDPMRQVWTGQPIEECQVWLAAAEIQSAKLLRISLANAACRINGRALPLFSA